MPGPRRVLVSGAGVAGPALGLLLHRLGYQVTIVERASTPRVNGQQIDISGQAITIVRRLGLDSDIRKCLISDDGIKFVDSNDRSWGDLALADTGDGVVKEYEILRGDLANVFYQRSKGVVQYMFGDSVTAIEQSEEDVTVSFINASPQQYDLVVGADGLRSKVRDLAFPAEEVELRSLDMVGAFFDIPWQPSDGSWTRWYGEPRRQTISLRPDRKRNRTGAFLFKIDPKLLHLARAPQDQQKAKMREIFGRAKWTETERILKHLDESEDLYMAEVAQMYCKTWVKDRVVLLGDAGYCPSPVSGQGTTIALIGAYVLAGCLSQHDDIREALQQYQTDLKPLVDAAQKLPPGTPKIANPETRWGLLCLYSIIWIFSLVLKTGLITILTRLFAPLSVFIAGEEAELPKYPMLEKALADVSED